MNEIICPHCTKAFKVDEASYAAILKQVRDHQFEEELQSRLHIAEQQKQTDIELVREKAKAYLQQQLSSKDATINELKAQNPHLAEKESSMLL